MKKILMPLFISAIISTQLVAKEYKEKIVIPQVSSGSKTAADDVYYNYRGQNPNRNAFQGMPYEKVDPFTGNLTIIHTDLVLPGKAGLDLKIMRYYNSSVWRNVGTIDEALVDISTSVVGLGWSMHMGRVIRPVGTTPGGDSKNQPLIELADGSQHIAYSDKNNTARWITKEYWRYENIGNGDYALTMTNGIKYIFGDENAYTIDGNTCYPVKSIQDPYGNTITITYAVISLQRVIDYIDDSYGRRVDFTYDTTTKLRLSQITANGKTYSYAYNLTYSHPLLTSVTSPAGFSWSYLYTTTRPAYELSKITTPQGGTIEYTYVTRAYTFSTFTNYFFVVNTRKLDNNTWTFSYIQPTAQSPEDKTQITAPNNVVYEYRYNGAYNSYSSGNKWKMGLPVYEAIGTSQTKTYTWINSAYISNDREWLYDAYDTQIFVPLLSSTVISRDGVNYTTTNSNFTSYGNPQNISETGQSTRTTALAYWSSGTYYVVDKPATKTVTVSGQSFGISYTYNPQGSVLTENKYGVTTTFTYYANGDIDRVTDASGSWIDYSNYAYGLPQTIQNPIYSITRTINWEGTVATETNGRGKTTSYLYDNANRLIRITPPLGDYTAITYASNCTWEKSTRGSYWSQKNYDGLGRSSGTTNVVGVNTAISYNSMGLKSYESYPYTSTNIGRSFEYDNLGRINKITNPDATTINYTFSGASTVVEDERSKTVTYTYRAFGDPEERWLMQVADAIGTTSYARNTLGSVTLITKGSLNRTYTYNTLNNFLTSETTPEAGTVNYAYNAIGLVTQRSDAERTINYGYDGINRLTSIDYPSDSADVTIGYDNANNRASLSSLVTSYTFVYDNADRMTSKVQNIEGRTYNLTFGYDTRDNLTSITYPDNVSVGYTYDNGNRTTAISGYITGITYHPSSGEATISYANGKTATISYNNRYRASGISVPGAIGYSYLYDGVGNLTTLTDNINSAYNQSYAYDDVNRVITANGPWTGNSYSYDIHGNITDKSVEYISNYGYNASTNRLTTADSWGYTYNGAGEVTGVTDGGWAWLTMTYDPAGRLKYFLDGNFGYPANYWYDGDGIRVKQYQKNGLPRNYSPGIVSALIPQTPPYVRYYVCNGNNTLAEYDEYNALKCKYIYLNGKLAAKVEGTSVYYYHSDYLGTPKAITNSSGTVVRTDNYYPFGKQYNYTGTYSNNRKFTAKERDWSGLDYFGARYYDCRIGRFLVPDPDLFGAPKEGSLSNPQRLNRYSYCLNNPYKYKDPTGKCGIDIHYVLTFNLATDASYGKINSINFSRDLSYANQSVDDIYGVNPFQGNFNSAVKNLINNFSSPYYKHFMSTKDAIQLVEVAVQTGNVVEFGETLHSLQDSYRHKGLLVPIRFGHALESIFNKKTPDSEYDENHAGDVQIKEITRFYINKFVNVNLERLNKEYPIE